MPDRVMPGRGWRWAGDLAFGLVTVLMALTIARTAALLPTVGAGGVLVDFDAFYIVGGLVREGRAAAAYDPAVMAAIQAQLIGAPAFMPWTYPPPFDLIAAVLPSLPRGPAYVLFTAVTLGAYLLILSRIAGAWRGLAALALAPPIYVGAVIGQNAFLTGALVGLYCLATLAGRAGAGWALGALAIKPHLALGLAVHALASGHWAVLARAAVLGLALAGVSTLALGPAVWPAFLGAVAEAGAQLRAGFYPLFRMPSVHAGLAWLGLPAAVTLAAQGAVALAALAAVALAVRRGWSPRVALALACFASGLVSPYVYDYDLTVAGVGLALVLPDLARRAARAELALLVVLFWVAGGAAMVQALGLAGLDWDARGAVTRDMPTIGALAWLAWLALVARILMRPEGRG